jgi:dethiobiotin synthetase
MLIVDVSNDEYQGVLAARIIRGQSTALLIDARWKHGSHQHQIKVRQALRGLSDKGHATVYRLTSSGDDVIEALLLDTYRRSAYPCAIVIENPENSADAMIVDANDQGVDASMAAHIRRLTELLPPPASSAGMSLFVSGDRSSVGKSTCCLALLITLIRAGVPAGDLAYIKPVTQCEAEQDVVRYCSAVGIECQGIGPVVFYKGFTRAFLNGETESSEQLVQQAVAAVRALQRKHKFVIVDGVGYPAVGSICGVSNAHVASSLNAPVWLIGKSGVGDAVDSYNLNAAFFKYHGCTVLGGLFNKLPLTGFYSLDACKDAVGRYFAIYASQSQERAYGFVPEIQFDSYTPVLLPSNASAAEIRTWQLSEALGAAFETYVNVDVLLADTYLYHLHGRGAVWDENNLLANTTQRVASAPVAVATASPTSPLCRQVARTNLSKPMSITSTSINKRLLPAVSQTSVGAKRSREEIEQLARQQGAKGS